MENSLSQLVDFITRPISNSILDLLTATSPQLTENLQGVPGISDHLIVTFHINMKPKMQHKPTRKIYSFQKADTNILKQKVEEFSQMFLDSKAEKKKKKQKKRKKNKNKTSTKTGRPSKIPSKPSWTQLSHLRCQVQSKICLGLPMIWKEKWEKEINCTKRLAKFPSWKLGSLSQI